MLHPLNYFRKNNAITILLAIVLSSCTVQLPSSYFYYQNEDNRMDKWPVITDENEDFRARVTPLENINDMLLFEIEVTNKSEKELEINPAEWKLHYSRGFEKTLPLETSQLPLTGSDINYKFQDLALQYEKAERQTKTATVIVGIVLIVGILVILASIDSDDDDDDEEEYDNDYGGLNLNVNFNSFTHPSQIDTWEEEDKATYYRRTGEFLRNENFGMTSIQPGQTETITLFYPRKNDARYVILEADIASESLEWGFIHNSSEIF